MYRTYIAAAYAIAGLLPSFAQTREPRPCPTRLAVLPTTRGDLLWEAPVIDGDTRERFELRECGVLLRCPSAGRVAVSLFEMKDKHVIETSRQWIGTPVRLRSERDTKGNRSRCRSATLVSVYLVRTRIPWGYVVGGTETVTVRPAGCTVTLITSLENGVWPPSPTPKTFVLRLE